MKVNGNLIPDEVVSYFKLGPIRAKRVEQILEHNIDTVDIFECFNEMLGGYGIAVIYADDGCTPIAEYINFGDTYSPTLLFDIRESEFKLTSRGDWYEKWEAAREQEIKLEYIGTVSEGTMRSDDLIPKFLDVAEKMAERLGDEYNIGECKLYRKRYNALSDNAPDEEWDYLLDEITCLLNELSMCPDGYYFGAHPGDGSDYGFWEVEKDE